MSFHSDNLQSLIYANCTLWRGILKLSLCRRDTRRGNTMGGRLSICNNMKQLIWLGVRIEQVIQAIIASFRKAARGASLSYFSLFFFLEPRRGIHLNANTKQRKNGRKSSASVHTSVCLSLLCTRHPSAGHFKTTPKAHDDYSSIDDDGWMKIIKIN